MAKKQGVRLSPRLLAAAGMLAGGGTAADIGCDHGRLGAYLLQQQKVQRLIACDISLPSLQKAKALYSLCGLGAELRQGAGLSVLQPGEADTIFLLGMGGTLIADILQSRPDVARGPLLVMQPMTSPEDLRYYLFNHGYDITEEKVVAEGGRFYQLIAARSGQPQPRPAGWPEQVFSLGWVALLKREPLLGPLVSRYAAGLQKKLAAAAPGKPEKLLEQLEGLRRILELLEEEKCHEAE